MSDGDGPVGKDGEADGALAADNDKVRKSAKAMMEFDVVEQRYFVFQPSPAGSPLLIKEAALKAAVILLHEELLIQHIHLSRRSPTRRRTRTSQSLEALH